MGIRDTLNSPVQGSGAEKALYIFGFFGVFVLEFFVAAAGLLTLGAGLAIKISDQNTSFINKALTSPLVLTGIVVIIGTVALFSILYSRLWKKISSNIPGWYSNVIFILISLMPFIFIILKAKVQ